jgi:hypothetical protein
LTEDYRQAKLEKMGNAFDLSQMSLFVTQQEGSIA